MEKAGHDAFLKHSQHKKATQKEARIMKDKKNQFSLNAYRIIPAVLRQAHNVDIGIAWLLSAHSEVDETSSRNSRVRCKEYLYPTKFIK